MANVLPELTPSEWSTAPEGTQFLIPLPTSDTAPFLAVDNCMVISPPPNSAQQRIGEKSLYVELLMMRTSFRAHAQVATMGPFDGENASISMSDFQMMPFNREIGRARFDIETAINLATAILKHVIETCDVDPELVRGRLVDRAIIESQVPTNE